MGIPIPKGRVPQLRKSNEPHCSFISSPIEYHTHEYVDSQTITGLSLISNAFIAPFPGSFVASLPSLFASTRRSPRNRFGRENKRDTSNH